MKFLVPNYCCLQNPWLRDYRPQIPVLSVLCPQLNLLTTPPLKKILGYATAQDYHHIHGYYAQQHFGMKCQTFCITLNLYVNMKLFLKYVFLKIFICECVIQNFSSVFVNASVSGPETDVYPVLTVCDIHELCTTVTGEPVTISLPSDLTLIEVQYVWTKLVLTEFIPCRW